jgi:hypothetical protein
VELVDILMGVSVVDQAVLMKEAMAEGATLEELDEISEQMTGKLLKRLVKAVVAAHLIPALIKIIPLVPTKGMEKSLLPFLIQQMKLL